ncbi:MAG: TM2 domain-containing protein [Gemmatimonadetes bacterium]|nr:TM2 domain-containing protein [Gemmatimonadota bacterium]MCY3943074.1 TM2 domain-containing protein [Gemmatimonadota bacterium]
MTADTLSNLKGLSEQERHLFQTEFQTGKKDPALGLILCLLLGGIGAHRFYLGEVGLGVVYLCFCWTFIPAIIALVELFMIMARVRRYNATLADNITIKLKALR